MIRSKELYFRANNAKGGNIKTNNQLLEDVYLNRILSEMYELIVNSSIKDNKYKVIYRPQEPIPVRHKVKIKNKFEKLDYQISFIMDTPHKFIMGIELNCELNIYVKELNEDKILGNLPREEVYSTLKQFYTNLSYNDFLNVLEDIRKNHSTKNQYGYNYNKLFNEMRVYYNMYYEDKDGIKMRKLYLSNGYDRLFKVGALQYSTDKEDPKIAPDIITNKYIYFYNYLKRYGLIKTESVGQNAPSIGKILEDHLSCRLTSVYDPLRNKIFYINENTSPEDTEKCIDILLKNMYLAEAVHTLILFINSHYPNKISSYDDWLYRKEMPINEEMRKKYNGLSEDLMRHLYYSNSGPNRILILERSPEVSTKSNYDRLRIQFGILGVKNKKKYLEDNKEEILKYVIDKASKNKYFQKVPINCFEITRIGINDSGDVTVIMELKKELLDMNKEDKK